MRNKILLPIWCAGLILTVTSTLPVAMARAFTGEGCGTGCLAQQYAAQRAEMEAQALHFFGGILMFIFLSVSVINLIIHAWCRRKYSHKTQSSEVLLSYRHAGEIANSVSLITLAFWLLPPELVLALAGGEDILVWVIPILIITLAIIAWLCWAIWRIHRWSEITTRRRRLVSISLATSIILSLLCLLWMLIIT